MEIPRFSTCWKVVNQELILSVWLLMKHLLMLKMKKEEFRDIQYDHDDLELQDIQLLEDNDSDYEE
jgi:hypothetical protein